MRYGMPRHSPYSRAPMIAVGDMTAGLCAISLEPSKPGQ
jgi:hypothetical protein